MRQIMYIVCGDELKIEFSHPVIEMLQCEVKKYTLVNIIL